MILNVKKSVWQETWEIYRNSLKVWSVDAASNKSLQTALVVWWMQLETAFLLKASDVNQVKKVILLRIRLHYIDH